METVQEPQIPTSVMETAQTPGVPALGGPVNILLLGASGVGKSTFINALCNYLTYASLDEAVKGELRSLIYCEFEDSNRGISGQLTTRKIVVGKPDSDEGGAKIQTGASCTQKCKAYTFPHVGLWGNSAHRQPWNSGHKGRRFGCSQHETYTGILIPI